MSNQIREYIDKQKSPQREICRRLHRLILDAFPDIEVGMKWGVVAFQDGLFYLVALKDHVNLGFSSAGLSGPELALFDGGGKTTRYLAIASLAEIDRARIVRLLKLVRGRAA